MFDFIDFESIFESLFVSLLVEIILLILKKFFGKIIEVFKKNLFSLDKLKI